MRKIALLVLLLLLAASCGKDEEKPRPRASASESAPPKPVLCPLTGEEAEIKDNASRAPLAVKIDNSGPGRPQAGLEAADIVYEELAEGGITRFLVVFQCSDASNVGPIRSARFVDPDLLLEYAPVLFAYSGAADPVLAKVKSTSGVADLRHGSNAKAYRRESSRKAPTNLFSSTEALRSLPAAEGVTGPPETGLEFEETLETSSPSPTAKASSPAAGSSASPPASPLPVAPPGANVAFSYAGSSQTRYTFDAATGKYLRFHAAVAHKTNDGSQVAATNVVVLKVPVVIGSLKDKAGNTSPDINVVGSGEATILKGGTSVIGKWTRSSLSAKTTLTDAAGAPIKLAPGNTWIHLLPNTRPVTVG